MLAEGLYREGARFSGAWNFGPADEDARPVQWLVERLAEKWGETTPWKRDLGKHPHEAGFLKLDVQAMDWGAVVVRRAKKEPPAQGAWNIFVTGTTVPDVNSGFRVFRKDVALSHSSRISSGFSFTTTLTLAMILSEHFVHYVPIEYRPRVGETKVRLRRDTLRMLQILVQAVLFYNPLKAFLALCCASVLAGLLIGGLLCFFHPSTGLNFLGSFSQYGINAVYFENYWNTGSVIPQDRYMDNIVVSTERIGCL